MFSTLRLPHQLPWMSGSKKHRREHSLAAAAHLLERGESRSTPGSAVPVLRGKSRVLAGGRGFGAALQGLCLVWFQRSLFNSNNW